MARLLNSKESFELFAELTKGYRERSSTRMLYKWLAEYPMYIFLRRSTTVPDAIELVYDMKMLAFLLRESVLWSKVQLRSWERDIKRIDMEVVQTTQYGRANHKIWRQTRNHHPPAPPPPPPLACSAEMIPEEMIPEI
jgi:hypothetical protein